MLVIKRPKEAETINRAKKWILVYGRRKTGKTFIVENFVDYDEYFFVKRDGSIISKRGDESMAYETFIGILKRALSENKTVVVDEFHRLGDGFFDFLHYTEKQGKLILISSTLFLSKKLISKRSPLLGFFAEVSIGLIPLEDCLNALKKFAMEGKDFLELALFFREPISIGYFDMGRSARGILADILSGSIRTVPALIGEIFLEEDRSISSVYEGILRAIAKGNVVSGGISSFLFSRGLIKKDDPSIIQQYLSNLMELGIIKRIEVYGKKRFIYKHASPLAKLFYYADEKYNISERKPGEAELGRIIDVLMPGLVEDSMREFFAEKFGLREAVMEAGDFDIDACLLRFKRPHTAVEIKWRGRITESDIKMAEASLERTGAGRKILFIQNRKGERGARKPLRSKKLEIMDASDLLKGPV